MSSVRLLWQSRERARERAEAMNELPDLMNFPLNVSTLPKDHP